MKNLIVSPCRRTRRTLALAGFVWFAGLSSAAAVDSYHYINRLGLSGPAYTGPGGTTNARLLGLNPAGFSIGVSQRYVGANDVWARGRFEQAVWLGNATGETKRLGFSDWLHTRDDGRQESYVLDLNTGGVTIGYSARFQGHADYGTTAWVEDRWGNIVRIGFYDASHTLAGGVKLSRPVDLNVKNQLVGYSEGTNPASMRTAWLATSTGKIQRIGYVDDFHTDDEGHRWSMPVAINDAGYVVGVSRYYAETTPPEGPGPFVAIGDTPWVRSPAGDMRTIGLYDGYSGGIDFLTESGFVAGWSRNPSEPFITARATWVARVNGPTYQVGVGDEFPYTDIFSPGISWLADLNELGVALGEAHQFATKFDWTNTGTGAWIADALGNTEIIGLYDSEHTTKVVAGTGSIVDGDHQLNHAVGLNENDAAIGYAERFDPVTSSTTSGQGGATAWVATLDGTTTRLGLTDAAHTRADGYRYSIPKGITPHQYVWGHSERYEGTMLVLGRTSWIYDRQTSTYAIFDLSAIAINNRWAIDITDVDETTGRVFGAYHNGDGSGYHAFTCLIGAAPVNLDTLDDAAPGEDGLQHFASTSGVTPNGYVAGRAVIAGAPGAAVYLVKRNE